MGTLIPLALTVAPEIARWLFGDQAAKTAEAVSGAVQTVTGTVDPDAASAILQQSPDLAGQLRVELARIAAEAEASARTAELDHFRAALGDVSDARAQTLSLSAQKSVLVWSTPIISAAVLLTFGIVMSLILCRGVPAGNETASNLLLGSLSAMATSIVSYWVGSSAGSARKDDRLAATGK